ncbi:MAG: TrmB family transcriptional regulator [Halolamina sp.]
MASTDTHDDDALRDELSTFGLSDTEIDTYLALLECGEASASTISETADVTQRAVYNIAERLEARGLIRVNDHASPTTIRALAPDRAIENLADRLESIKPSLEARFNETTPQTPEIQIVKSGETALKRLRTAISGATEELLVAVPEDVYPEIEAELRAAVDRDAVVFLLLGSVDEIDGDGGDYAGVADVVRYWDESLPLVYTTDDQSAMIGDSELLTGTHADEMAVTVSQSDLSGSILGMYFSAYWPAATELYVTEPDPLPATYDWFRQATLQGVLHRRAGVDLSVAIETDDGTFVTGPVAEIRQAFVEPATNDFTLETSFVVETDSGLVSVGGPGSFIEDHQAESVTLARRSPSET